MGARFIVHKEKTLLATCTVIRENSITEIEKIYATVLVIKFKNSEQR